jgi:argininosuccinate synthase
VTRTIFAFNGDLESRLALHWLAQEHGYEVITLSINLGQGQPLDRMAELALELGAVAAQVVDCQDLFLRQFAMPLLQADAVYQSGCFLGSALARYVIAQELVRVADEEGCRKVAHSAASKGNDQVRMETAIAALQPDLEVLAPVRQWNLRTLRDKVAYAKRHHLPIEEPTQEAVSVDRNLWGVSVYLHELKDSWSAPPPEAFVLTRAPEQAPDQPTVLELGFDQGVPRRLNGEELELVPLVRRLNLLGGEHGVGRCDVVEDRLFGIKSREFYEAPAALILHQGHRELEALVHSREWRLFQSAMSQRYAELAYAGHWFHELRRSLDAFFQHGQARVSGEVRLRLFKGLCAVQGRRSPYSLYDSQLANQSNLELFDNQWAQGFTSLWTLASRLAARRPVPGNEHGT